MFNKLFSKNKKQKNKLTFDVSIRVRNRIYATLNRLSNIGYENKLNDILIKIARNSYEEYGELQADRGAQNPILSHFLNCDSEKVLDFIEMYFRYMPSVGIIGNEGVDAINQIFIEENIGYQFTNFEIINRGYLITPYGNKDYSINVSHYPQAILKSDDYSHQIIEEVLIVINDKKFYKTSEEFRKALRRFKENDLTGTMTNCGQAIESTLKFICDKKGWTYDVNDTASKLIIICKNNGLFPLDVPVYSSIIENVASLRNKLSDAHGRHGQSFVVAKNHVQHLLNLTATNIIFLATL